MPKDEIIVEIETDGTSTVSVKGVSGPACKMLTKDLEAALGAPVSTQTTPEFAQRQTQTHRPRQQQR